MLELLVFQTNQKKGYVITGDVDFENVSKSKFYYSVPGGVGPMTIAMLLKTRCWQEK
jgi:methylenetetrahydrofolate dehydrogenase (NADP+)/methenyltetrahydrofolate cyclohydrolase